MALSCNTSSSVDASGYLTYVDDINNDLVKIKELTNVIYTVKYEPVEYKTLKDFGNINKLDSKEFETKRNEYSGLCYFNFKIESKNSNKSPIKSIARSKEDLSKLFQYCNTELEKDFYLESGDLIIPCKLFHFEDDHQILNYNLVSLAFESDKIDLTKNDIVLVYNDHFFNNGLLKFNFSKESIQSIPKLIF